MDLNKVKYETVEFGKPNGGRNLRNYPNS